MSTRVILLFTKVKTMKKVAVIGAGIAGITAAYFIARLGYKVTVIEQEKYPAMRTSFANGGQISVSNSEVWNTWSNVKKGVKWMFTKDAPLLVRPRWDHLSWLARFLWVTATQDPNEHTKQTIRLGLKSRQLYKEMIKTEHLQFDQRHSGILHFYRDHDYWAHSVRQSKYIYEDNGCEWTTFNSGVKTLDPALEHFDSTTLGYAWTKDDWTGDIHKFCAEMRHVLENKYDVDFCFDAQVAVLEHLQKFDVIVVAAGIGSVNLARSIGDSLPIYPVKGYSITVNVREDQMHMIPKVSLLDDQAKIVSSTLGNRFRVAGTAEFAGENYDIRRDRIEPLLRWIHDNFPNLDTSSYSSWACLRPMTPDMMPIVRQSRKNAKVFYHTGHGHLGWTISPATAHSVAKLVHEYLRKDT